MIKENNYWKVQNIRITLTFVILAQVPTYPLGPIKRSFGNCNWKTSIDFDSNFQPPNPCQAQRFLPPMAQSWTLISDSVPRSRRMWTIFPTKLRPPCVRQTCKIVYKVTFLPILTIPSEQRFNFVEVPWPMTAPLSYRHDPESWFLAPPKMYIN